MELEPIEPETAVELYLADREPELASITLKSHRSRLGFFVQWCEEQGIDNLNELTGRKINEYRLWRRNTGDLAPANENCQMDTLRVFVRWLESIDGAPKDLHEKVRSPAVGRDEGSRDVMIDADDAEEVLSYLETYYYATLDHVTISLLWHTMLRRGAAHSLDVADYHPEDSCLEIRHRPDTGTPLKNGKRGERLVALSGWLCNLLDDWLRDRRPDVVDENGREPLLATSQGRIGKSPSVSTATAGRVLVSMETGVHTIENSHRAKRLKTCTPPSAHQASALIRSDAGVLHITSTRTSPRQPSVDGLT